TIASSTTAAAAPIAARQQTIALGAPIFGAATSAFGPQDIQGLQAGVLGLSQSVYSLGRGVQRGYEGTAVAVALGGASYLPDNKFFSVTGNFGTFRGQYGLAAQAQLRLNEWAVVNAGIGAGLKYGGS
ncbi:MAG: Cell surface protein, partial [Methylocystaceae bacterium]